MKRTMFSGGRLAVFIFACLALVSLNAYAEIETAGMLDDAIGRYQAVARDWSDTITKHASWLFWILATISMVWTFGLMALRKADLGEFFAEFIRFTLFTGFFWWLLVKGPGFAINITDSLRQIAAEAARTPNKLSPSGIVDIGFDVFLKVLDKSTVWKPIDSLIGILIAVVVLVVFALVGVNMLILLVSGWILAYAGTFFLGFGGSRWTSEMAIGYFKTVLNIGAQLFSMILIVGIGQSFVDQFYVQISQGMKIKDLAAMLIVAVILLALVNKIPPLIGNLAGGNTGALGSGFGAGAALAAAAMGAAAISGIGAAVAAGAAGAAGGAQALLAAFSKANEAESGGGVSGNIEGSPGGGDGGPESDSMTNDAGNGGGSALASAMGDSDSGSQSSGNSFASGTPNSIGSSTGDTSAKGGQTGAQQPGLTTKVGSTAARAGKVALGSIANLAQGSYDVAKGSFTDRIANTTGGKIAAAIQAREQVAKNDGATSFAGDTLSAGKDSADAASEIAAFRDRDSC